MSTRYMTLIDGEAALVEILRRDGDLVHARLSFEESEEVREVTFNHRRGPDGRYHVRFEDGRILAGRVIADRPDFRITGGAVRLHVRAMNEMDALLGADGMGADESSVTVSMPGRVVKIMVAEGDAVEVGQALMVVEAMKMENEVKAGRAGVVAEVHVAEGESVDAEALLMTIGDP